ncbi:hypothetical protein MIMGU_mgv1a015078mg [Erythranthe guttata]|uniref:Uncharacterized protein n=1 Tax=Erythranthe guttata TaxID=4155 RepID=A0A022RAW0_ERYGU|nr:hypothetical protein MIMGU_mgv1a015078mg [Erythranthe guttata]
MRKSATTPLIWRKSGSRLASTESETAVNAADWIQIDLVFDLICVDEKISVTIIRNCYPCVDLISEQDPLVNFCCSVKNCDVSLMYYGVLLSSNIFMVAKNEAGKRLFFACIASLLYPSMNRSMFVFSGCGLKSQRCRIFTLVSSGIILSSRKFMLIWFVVVCMRFMTY